MKLPNYKNAIIDKEKLTEYCLNEDHPIGKHKARVFKSVLGITAADFELLIQIIFEGIQTYQAIKKETDQYGTRFYVDIENLSTNKPIIIRTNWIIKRNEEYPRLTSCYIIL